MLDICTDSNKEMEKPVKFFKGVSVNFSFILAISPTPFEWFNECIS